MLNLDSARITEHIKTIETNLQELETLRGRSFEDFEQDSRSVAAAKYWLQTAVQAMIDISSHICARLGLAVQQDSGESIRALEKRGLFSKDRATMYVKMIRFRNVLVHLYGEVDDHRVHEILENELDYFRMYMMDVDMIVESERKKKSQRQVRRKR
jgi:uncharacterized protein YutE (UPF0331/DUF86 family)